MTDPWLPPAQQYPTPPSQPAAQPAPAYALAQQQGPPHRGHAPQAGGFGFPAPPVAAPPRTTSGIAIAALAVAVVALLGVIGLGLMALGEGALDDSGEYTLEGTLPQAEAGRTYTALEVRSVVEEVLDRDWSTYEDLSCEPLTFEVGATTSCTGVVDDFDTELEIDVDDDVGHFTLTQYW